MKEKDQGWQGQKAIRPHLVRCNEEVTSQFMNQRTRKATNGNICWSIVDVSLLFYSCFMEYMLYEQIMGRYLIHVSFASFLRFGENKRNLRDKIDRKLTFITFLFKNKMKFGI